MSSIKVKVGLEGVESVEQGFKRVGDSATRTFRSFETGGAKLDRTSRDLNKFGQALGELGGGSLMTAARQLDNLTDGFQALRESVRSVNFGVMAAGAAAIGAATYYFERLAAASEEVSKRLAQTLGPGTDLYRRARGVGNESERQSVVGDIDAEITRLTARRRVISSQLASLNPLTQSGEAEKTELAAILTQLRELNAFREKMAGSLGAETIAQNELNKANKEASEWLKANGDSYQRQIEMMQLAEAPLARQVELLEKEKRALQELYVNTSGASPMGEKARLEIRKDELEIDQKIAQAKDRLAQQEARDAAETKRQVKEINAEWAKQVEHLNRIGEELQRNAQARAQMEAQMRDQVRGSTYAGASADFYGQRMLNGLTEQAYGVDGPGAGAIAGIQNAVTLLGTTASQVGNAVTSSIGGALDGISSSIEGLIRGTMTWADAFRNVGMAILNSVVTAFARMIAQMMVSFILQKIFGKAMQAQAHQVGAAWTSAAISASIASYGTAAGVGLGAFLAAQAAGQAATVGMSGFSDGGFTGNIPASSTAGVVHGQEFVFSAPAVRRVGLANLEAMHEGAKSGTPATGKGGVIIVDDRREAARIREELGEAWVMEVVTRNRHRFG